MKKFGLLCVAFAMLVSSVNAAETIVARGSTWSFINPGTDPGAAFAGPAPGFAQPAFDDSAWLTGAAPLGWGTLDGNAANPAITPNTAGGVFATNAAPSAYFRLDVDGGATGKSSVRFDIARDDAAIIYLNGVEIGRSSANAAQFATYVEQWAVPVAPATLPPTQGNDANESTYHTLPGLFNLLPGNNVIAVSLHQSSLGSSDGVFDLGAVIPDPVVPTATLTGTWLNDFTSSNIPVATTDQSAAGVTVVQENGSDALRLNQTPNAETFFNATTPYFSIPAGGLGVEVSVDFKIVDTSSGLEDDDVIRVRAEYSTDGISFTTADAINTSGAASDIYMNPVGGTYFHGTTLIPATATMARVIVNLANDSASETIFVDNIRIAQIPVPEPGSVAMIGLGMIGMIGYGIRRRRSA